MNRRSILAFLGLAPVAIPAAAMRMPDRPAVPGIEHRRRIAERLMRHGAVSPNWARRFIYQDGPLAPDRPVRRVIGREFTIRDKAGAVVFHGTDADFDMHLTAIFEEAA
jgi:hypothetical protein